MKRVVLFAAILCAPLFAAAEDASSAPATTGSKDIFVQGDAAAGAAKASVCFACHGPGGSGAINPQWPKLAGQHAGYIYEQLTDFKAMKRKQPVMMGQASALADEDMRNVAAYFASQKPVPGVASKDAVAIAQPLFRGGDASRGLPACLACHGPEGAGNAAARFPRIGGQNADYTVNQLKAYAACGASDFTNCDRGTDANDKIMSTIAAKLKDNEIQALGSYVSGLQ